MRYTREAMAARVLTRATQHSDWDIRAAAQLACDSNLLPKIAQCVTDEGWIDWAAVATYVIEGTPWSGGEVRLAKLACSISGRLRYVEDGLRGQADIGRWDLAECLYGLDRVNLAAALNAVHLVTTGQPLPARAEKS